MSDLVEPSPKKGRWRLIRAIGRGFTVTRNFVLNVLFWFLFVTVLIAIFSREDKESLPNQAALLLNPGGSLVEQKTYSDPMFDLLFSDDLAIETLINDLLDALKFAATDDRVKLLLLDFSRLFDVDFAEVERIQEALTAFKKSGKPIWAFDSSYSQGTYLLAMNADRVLMDPMGELILSGVSSSSMHYKSLLDKLAIDVHVYAVGEFKSAVEPYTREDMSDAARTVGEQLVQTLWQRTKQRIVSYRNIEETQLDTYTSRLHELASQKGKALAQLAVDFGLVDELIAKSELTASYRKVVGQNVRQISFNDYLPHVVKDLSFGREKVAIVVIQGEILGTESQLTGQSNMWVQQINKVTRNPQYKALVLRVISPGGSVFESEDIRRALVAYKKTDRPLVASFGGTAASGGYWIALPADSIFATPVTITGSVGVFGLYPNLGNSLHRIGITNDVIRSTPYGLGSSLIVEPTEELHEIRTLSVKRYYNQFVNLVASAREKPVTFIEDIAQGRIWLGEDALKNGLVDELGELNDAVAKAADLAGLSTYEIEYVRPLDGLLSPLSRFVNASRAVVLDSLLQLSNDSLREYLSRELRYLRDPTNVYARCVSCDIGVQ